MIKEKLYINGVHLYDLFKQKQNNKKRKMQCVLQEKNYNKELAKLKSIPCEISLNMENVFKDINDYINK